MAPTVASLPSEPRFRLHRVVTDRPDFEHDVREGLTAARKTLRPHWFYDELGSALFDAICFLPEYYVMRAEAEILSGSQAEIRDALGQHLRLVELGSGSARKTRILLDALAEREPDLEYAPIDIDESMLDRTARELLLEYPRLRVTAVCSDFTKPAVPMAALSPHRGRTVVLFLGSTIGNSDPGQAAAMLQDLRSSLRPGDALLLGADLKKSRHILDAAYDDALGVTAAFNLNLLARINRELGGHFDLRAFRHRAFYDEDHGRIEMHLDSARDQNVAIDALGLTIEFREGESIHTESSYKHDDGTLATLASAAGFRIEKKWTDERGWFADVLMVAE